MAAFVRNDGKQGRTKGRMEKKSGAVVTGLADVVFDSKIVAMASAVFGPWSAVSGSGLASYRRRKMEQVSCGLLKSSE